MSKRTKPVQHAPLPSTKRYPPTVEGKRQMLTNFRDQFRAKGYEAELNIEAVEAQTGIEDAEDQIEKLKAKAANCYASARRMDEMLMKLPAPKPSPKAAD